MSKPIVVQTCWMPEDILSRYCDAGKIELRLWKPEPGDQSKTASREWIMEHVPGATALLCIPMNKVDEVVMERAGASLKVISTMSVGYEHIDCEAAKKRGIRIGYTPDVLSGAVADLALLLSLNLMRNVIEGYFTVKDGVWASNPWSPLSFCGPALEGKTVGFLGFGSISQTLVRKLMPFRPAQILYQTARPRPFDMHEDYFRHIAKDDVLQCYFKCHGRLPVPVENEPDTKRFATHCDVILYVLWSEFINYAVLSVR